MATTTAAPDDTSSSTTTASSDSTAASAPSATVTDYTSTGPQTVTEFAQNADEFCASLSVSDRRVEMISAFHAMELKAGRARDLPSAYAARYQAFLTQPA